MRGVQSRCPGGRQAGKAQARRQAGAGKAQAGQREAAPRQRALCGLQEPTLRCRQSDCWASAVSVQRGLRAGGRLGASALSLGVRGTKAGGRGGGGQGLGGRGASAGGEEEEGRARGA